MAANQPLLARPGKALFQAVWSGAVELGAHGAAFLAALRTRVERRPVESSSSSPRRTRLLTLLASRFAVAICNFRRPEPTSNFAISAAGRAFFRATSRYQWVECLFMQFASKIRLSDPSCTEGRASKRAADNPKIQPRRVSLRKMIEPYSSENVNNFRIFPVATQAKQRGLGFAPRSCPERRRRLLGTSLTICLLCYNIQAKVVHVDWVP